MLFQKFQFGLYSFLLRFKIIPILLLLIVIGWSYFSISFYFRFNNKQTVYFEECITKYIDQHQTKQQGYLLPINSILKIVPVYSKAQLECQIINDNQKSILEIDQIHLFRDVSLQYLPKDVKQKHNINQTKIYMNMDKLAQKVVYDYFGIYQILISNIADFLQNKQLKGIRVRQLTKHQETVEVNNIHSKSKPVYFFSKFIVLIDSILRVFFCSVFAGIIMIAFMTVIIRVIIICGQIVYKLTKNDTILVYFPFLNHYLESLRESHKQYVIKYILLAYIGVGFIILYGLSYFVNSLLKSSLIGLYYKEGNTIGFYESIVIEFASLIILRTRTSIKHSPKIILSILITTRFMAEFNPFKLPLFYVSLGFQLSIIYLLLVLLIVESSIVKSRGLDLPSKQIPRALFFPNYNLAWHHIIPPIWTYFVPPHSRKFFNQNQLSYVQGQYQRLYCLLMGLPIQNQEQIIQREYQPDHEGRAQLNQMDMVNILL